MTAWDPQPWKLACVCFSVFLPLCMKGQPWGTRWGEDSQERSCKLKICYRLAAMLLGPDLGVIFQLLSLWNSSTKHIIRDLEIPESIGCRWFPERKQEEYEWSQGLRERDQSGPEKVWVYLYLAFISHWAHSFLSWYFALWQCSFSEASELKRILLQPKGGTF